VEFGFRAEKRGAFRKLRFVNKRAASAFNRNRKRSQAAISMGMGSRGQKGSLLAPKQLLYQLV